jgi:hypothetical protein
MTPSQPSHRSNTPSAHTPSWLGTKQKNKGSTQLRFNDTPDIVSPVALRTIRQEDPKSLEIKDIRNLHRLHEGVALSKGAVFIHLLTSQQDKSKQSPDDSLSLPGLVSTEENFHDFSLGDGVPLEGSINHSQQSISLPTLQRVQQNVEFRILSNANPVEEIVLQNGTLLIGHILDGKLNGEGIKETNKYSNNPRTYEEGYFTNNQLNGDGFRIYSDGSTEIGEFVKGKLQGEGIVIDFYAGEVEITIAQFKHGKTKLPYDKNKEKYKGEHLSETPLPRHYKNFELLKKDSLFTPFLEKKLADYFKFLEQSKKKLDIYSNIPKSHPEITSEQEKNQKKELVLEELNDPIPELTPPKLPLFERIFCCFQRCN